MRLRVVGGPGDGGAVAEVAERFRWIGPDGDRGYAKPREGCGLYRRVRGSWRFAGAEAWFCGSCGALVVERASACVLCGTERQERQ